MKAYELRNKFKHNPNLPPNPSPDLLEMILAQSDEDQDTLLNSTKVPCGTCKNQVVVLAHKEEAMPQDIIAIALKWKVSFASLYWVYRGQILIQQATN